MAASEGTRYRHMVDSGQALPRLKVHFIAVILCVHTAERTPWHNGRHLCLADHPPYQWDHFQKLDGELQAQSWHRGDSGRLS